MLQVRSGDQLCRFCFRFDDSICHVRFANLPLASAAFDVCLASSRSAESSSRVLSNFVLYGALYNRFDPRVLCC